MRALTLAILYLLVTAGVARANGRFPDAQTIVHAPNDPKTVYVRTTFGVLVTHDEGKSWRWICEKALGFSGTWDPPLAVGSDGALWVGLPDGIRVTRDGCTFEPKLEHVAAVYDLTTDPAGKTVLAAIGGGTVWQDGKTTAIAKGDALKLETIEVAPSNTSRVYATAVPNGTGTLAHLFVNGAETHPKLPFDDARLFIAAIDPKNDRRVLVRAMRPDGSDVLVSDDGGKTFRSTLHVAGSLFGFAKSADGVTYYAGSGDPREGVYRSKDRGEHWENVARVRTYCLHLVGERLYACSTPFGKSGSFAIGASDDGGKTFQPLLAKFADVEGPACDAACGADWPAVHATLAPKIDAPPVDAGDVPDAGSPPSARGSKCSCRTPGAPENSSDFWLFALVLAGLCGSRAHHHTRTRRGPRAGAQIARGSQGS